MKDPEAAVAVEPAPCPYSMQPTTLFQLNSDKDSAGLQALGGVQGLSAALHSDLHSGLSTTTAADLGSVESHKAAYGANRFPDKPPPSFITMLFAAAQDPMIIILLVVAFITIVIGAAVPEQRAHQGWSEGIAVLGTALIVVLLGAGQDYSKELQFQKLNALKDIIEVKVTRDGKLVLIPNTEVVVGDVMFLDTGDKIIADGIVIDSQSLVIDEASLTGESDPIKKNAISDPWVRSGTTVADGSGHMLVVAVGVNSEWGKTMTLVSEAGDDETPLQEQLADLATKISKLGVAVALICFLALFIKWLIVNKGWNNDKVNSNGPLQHLLYAITITVVSIPEGLPLAVTLTLAYSMKKMMKDNNFVRVLSACETMGGATAICSDKTGTLTENRMTVVEGWFCGTAHSSLPAPEQLPPGVVDLLKVNCAMNSKAFLVDQPTGVTDFVGSSTECALLVMLRKLGHEYTALREQLGPSMVKLYGFSSARKMASVLMKDEGGKLRLYNKGAAEWVLRRCTSWLGPDGTVCAMDDSKQEELAGIVTAMAKRGLRCICLTYRDYPEHDPSRAADFFEDPDRVDRELTACAIVGIKDPVRAEVPEAVVTCQRAGIVVRMVTGDNIHTAQHIAAECGILDTSQGHIAMEGPKFRAMPATELIPLLPNLRVLARSSPEDKLTLVRLLKQQGEVVAVTGDGTNDAPALKESDVGLAMGIAGTEVAKEAADIIIMDDNFSSIVKAVLWGRGVYMNIRKFLVFQLSINIVAMVSAAVGALYGGVPPLNVLQLLWVNMIMDTLAALALATEEPYPHLLEDMPHGRHERLITGTMWTHMLAAAVYKGFWLFSCLYALPQLLDSYRTLTGDSYFKERCTAILPGKGFSATEVPLLCNYLGFCGFPEGVETRGTTQCLLYQDWMTYNNTVVPNTGMAAVCRTSPVGENCPLHQRLAAAGNALDDEYDREILNSYKPALSVLFNSFILAQVGNAYVSRRIGYEYNFFEGISKSHIFNGIMVLVTVLQVIIMQTPVAFIFKVQALNGPEWAFSIGVGLGALIWSLLVRVVMNLMRPYLHTNAWLCMLRGKRMQNITASGAEPAKLARSESARTASGRTASGRAMSGRAAHHNPSRMSAEWQKSHVAPGAAHPAWANVGNTSYKVAPSATAESAHKALASVEIMGVKEDHTGTPSRSSTPTHGRGASPSAWQ